MWFFNAKRQLGKSGLLNGFTDCHCHILPGVDDGVETTEDALAILVRYEQTGIRKVWLTPHIMEDMPNTTDSLRQRFAALKAAYHGPITLCLSAENMLDSVFSERFRTGDLLPWGDKGDRLLVETSYFTAPANFASTLQSIKSKGFFPILAHPERYVYLGHQDYFRLKKKGIELQLNLFSLIGMYGRRVKDNAEFILKNGLYDYAATDLHDLESLETALKARLSRKILARIPTQPCPKHRLYAPDKL